MLVGEVGSNMLPTETGCSEAGRSHGIPQKIVKDWLKKWIQRSNIERVLQKDNLQVKPFDLKKDNFRRFWV